MASAAAISEIYNNPLTGLSVGRVKEQFPDRSRKEIEELGLSVPQMAVHRQVKAGPNVHARYQSDGLYVHADHTFYTLDGVPAKNEGYGVILVVVDVLTRYAFARALKSKSGSETAEALEDIFTEYANVFGRRPDTMQTDKAREFMGKSVGDVLNKSKTKLVHSNNQRVGAAVAEAFNRQLRKMISRWFTVSMDEVWFNVLPDIMKNYNSRKHSTLRLRHTLEKMDPVSKALTPLQAVQLFKDGLSWKLPTSSLVFIEDKSPELPIGTTVRVREPEPTGLEHKTQNWSSKVYRIGKVRTEASLKGEAVNLYTVVHPDGSDIVSNTPYGLTSNHKFRVDDLLPSPLVEEVVRRRRTKEEKALADYRTAIDAVIRSVDAALFRQTDPKQLSDANKNELLAFVNRGEEPKGMVVRTRVENINEFRELRSQLVNARADAVNREDIVALRAKQKDALALESSNAQRLAMDRRSRSSNQSNGPVNTSKPLIALKSKVAAALQ